MTVIDPRVVSAFTRLDRRLQDVVDSENRRAAMLAGDGTDGWDAVRALATPGLQALADTAMQDTSPVAPSDDDLPFGRLRRALSLDLIDLDVLLLLLAPFVEPRYQALYALLQDDARQPLATERLIRAVLGGDAERLAILTRCLDSGSPLLRSGVVQAVPGLYAPLAQPFTLPSDVVAALLGDEAPRLTGTTGQTWTSGTADSELGISPQAEGLRPPCEILSGAGDLETAARDLLPSSSRILLARLDPDGDPRNAIDMAWRIGVCSGTWPVIDLRDLPAESIADLARRAILRVQEMGGRIWLLTSGPVTTPAPHVVCRTPPWSRRVEDWLSAAKRCGRPMAPVDAQRLAGRHRLNPHDIDQVLQTVPSDDFDSIDRAARFQRLFAPRHAILRIPQASLDDLVLRAPTREALDRLIHFVDHRDRIGETLPVGAHFPLDRGPIALFHGRPGTGKTMAAEAVSHALGRLLHVVDVSQLVSKYIGDTEKHIDETLVEAERAGAAILFDEADSLFARRIERADSAAEQFSNMVVGYLLQRMEAHDGLIMLASNLAQGIDPAFMRRFLFRVEFPLPDGAERARIWDLLLVRHGSRDLDTSRLAEAHRLSGGEIRNAAMKAIFLADSRGVPLGQALAEEAVRLELFELGRLSRASDMVSAGDRGFVLRKVGNRLQELMEAHLRTLFLKEIHVLEGPPTERNLSGHRPALSIAMFRLAGRRSDGRNRDGEALRVGVILSAWSSRAEEEHEILGAAHAYVAALPSIEAAGHPVELRMQESHDFELLQRFWSSHEQPMKPSILIDLEIH